MLFASFLTVTMIEIRIEPDYTRTVANAKAADSVPAAFLGRLKWSSARFL
jgi:hypothetical protein